jgi:Recombinase zinc beta ribbon domain
LKNEKYKGLWIWRKEKNVRDPISGKRKKIARAAHEQISSLRTDLIIIHQDIWEKAQARWILLEGSSPKTEPKAKNPFKSYVHTSPTHLLAGILKCKCCGGAMIQISGKAGGYYGCYNHKRKTCSNKMLIQRIKVEKQILEHLKTQILTTENIKYILDNAEKEALKNLNDLPEELKIKRQQHEKIQTELKNLLNFIKAGNFSKVVSDAITDAEERNQRVSSEIESLEFQRKSAFKAPSKDWIKSKLDNFLDILNQNTTASALALKDLFGSIEMEPKSNECVFENGMMIQKKAHYLAHSKIDTLALIEESQGSNSLQMRRGWDSNPRCTFIHTRFPSVLNRPL